jgi:hypothetical protein
MGRLPNAGRRKKGFRPEELAVSVRMHDEVVFEAETAPWLSAYAISLSSPRSKSDWMVVDF